MKFRMTMSALVLAGLCTANASFAADTKAPTKTTEAAPTAEQKAMMDWMTKNQPGEGQKMLATRAGEWNLEVKSWMDPKGPPQVTKATASAKMIMDGRYLQETTTGDMGGAPFSGMGYSAYDNMTKKYKATWIDSMSTGIFSCEGSYDPSSKSITMTGETYEPMAGKVVGVKTVTRFVDDKSYVFEWWAPAPGGDMFKSMEITYTRQ
jgi:hypothetical protein